MCIDGDCDAVDVLEYPVSLSLPFNLEDGVSPGDKECGVNTASDNTWMTARRKAQTSRE